MVCPPPQLARRSTSGHFRARSRQRDPTYFTWNTAEGGVSTLAVTATGPNKTDIITGPNGLPVEQVAYISGFTPNPNLEWYYPDLRGDSRAVYNLGGTRVRGWNYSTWGTAYYAGSSNAGQLTPLLFQGQFVDSTSGLQYLQARWYDPATAMFLTVDPAVSDTLSVRRDARPLK